MLKQETWPRQGTLELGESLRKAIINNMLPARQFTARRNEYIYQCGQPDRCVYLVERGCVKTVMYSVSGKECLLDIHPRGDIFGESGIVNYERVESAVAMVGTTVRALPLKTFLGNLAGIGCLDALVQYVVGRSARQQQSISEFVTHDSEHRLAARLVNLGHKLGVRENYLIHIQHKITHEELASMVGTTRSRIGHFLKNFQEYGLIATCQNRHLLINEPRLLAYLNADQ